MRKLFAMILALCLVLMAGPAAFAEETTAPVETTEATRPVREPDQCGEDLRWSYEDGVLTITGTGPMDDFEDGTPWTEHKEEIEKLVLSGVTYIGAEAFRDYDTLKEIDFGSSIKEIGTRAFYGCDGLTSIDLPMSFKVFGEESMRACTSLKEIHCEGGFPSFRLNCMWETYVTIFFPAERPWPVSLIEELEGAFQGRIEFLASDGSDPYVPTEAAAEPEETEAPTTEAPTEAPTVETTVPQTEAAEPETETTAPETTAVPVETEGTEATEVPETTESMEEETENGLSAMKVVVIGLAAAVVLTVICALLLIFRRSSHRGKYEY